LEQPVKLLRIAPATAVVVEGQLAAGGVADRGVGPIWQLYGESFDFAVEEPDSSLHGLGQSQPPTGGFQGHRIANFTFYGYNVTQFGSPFCWNDFVRSHEMTSNRRTFLKSAAATVAATWIGSRSHAAEQPPAVKPHPIRLGGPLFNAPADPVGLARMKRRFLIFVGALALTSPCLSAAERPNILFLFADDWGRYAGCYAGLDGRPTISDVAKTPNIDRIAREGVIFRNAFVAAPSCTPCRSSLLSGQYFFRTGGGAILQGATWNPKIPAYPLMLRDAGYHIGKAYKVWSPGTPVDAPYGGQK
jgi:hypothetical protein